MKRIFILAISIFGLSTANCFAQQDKIDSFLKLLKTDKVDTNKLFHLNKLSREYTEVGSYDSAMLYANSSLEIGNVMFKGVTDPKIKQTIQKDISASYNNIGTVYESQGNFQEALKNYFACLKIREAIGDKKGSAAAYNNIGVVYDDEGNYSEALKNYSISLKIKESIVGGDKKGIAYSYNNIGIIYEHQGNYPEALKNHLASLKIEEAINDQKGIGYTLNNIGNVYDSQNNYAEALKNYNAALKIRIALGEKSGIATSYSNIGLVYYQQFNFSEALKNDFAALEIRKAIGDQLGIAASYNNIGNVYKAQGNYPEALKSFFASLKIRETIGDTAGITASYGNIGQVLMKQKKYNDAEEYLFKAKDLSREIGYKEYLREVYSLLTELDSARGNYKGAYENQKLFILYRDSMDNEETRKKTIQSQMTFDFEKKEAVANTEHKKELENQAALAEEKSRKQKIVIGSLIIGAFLMLVFASFIFRSLRVTRKQKNIIELQKILVEEKQKEILDSIHYAKRIQQSLLPSPKYIEKNLKRLNQQKTI